ncbi:rCG22248 [Rattus norvegicus]|uniref:RCG22248 n=1 Tax=Rattus norvegicus TaxID=10116 RepID=A6IPE9_RAT|nr:rCG22248 [Rattus norvegicus]
MSSLKTKEEGKVTQREILGCLKNCLLLLSD